MVEGAEVLAGGYRLARVRETKRMLYVVQFLLMLVIVIFLINAEGGFSLKPFYLPINSFIYFLILMLLVFNVENFFFKALEIKFSKTESAKYYISKLSLRRSITVIVIAIVVVLLLWLPPLSSAVEDSLSKSGEIIGTEVFYNKDFLGLTTTNRITLSCDGEAVVYIVSEENYMLYHGNLDKLRYFRINIDNYVVNPVVSFEFPYMDYGKYYFVIDERYSSTITVHYKLHQNLSPTFLGFVPLFAMFFVSVNIGWISYILPQLRKFREKAIYR